MVACYVVDVNLPGASGLTLLERLRARGDQTPAVLITSHPSVMTRYRADRLQAVIVVKPLMGDVLQRRVSSLVRPLN